jgi:hypothetical protein
LKNKNKNVNKNFLPTEIRKKTKRNLDLKNIGDSIYNTIQNSKLLKHICENYL